MQSRGTLHHLRDECHKGVVHFGMKTAGGKTSALWPPCGLFAVREIVFWVPWSTGVPLPAPEWQTLARRAAQRAATQESKRSTEGISNLQPTLN